MPGPQSGALLWFAGVAWAAVTCHVDSRDFSDHVNSYVPCGRASLASLEPLAGSELRHAGATRYSKHLSIL